MNLSDKYNAEIELAREQAELADDAGMPKIENGMQTEDPANEHRLNARLHLEIARELRLAQDSGTIASN